MTDKELWPIVKAAAEGKRVEYRPHGGEVWRETVMPGWHRDTDYRIAPHDCDKDGHEWKRETYRGFAGEAGLWVDEKCEHCPATRRERFALDPTPPPPPRLMVCPSKCAGCPTGEPHKEDYRCADKCVSTERICTPYLPPSEASQPAPRYRPWTEKEAPGKVVVDLGGCGTFVILAAWKASYRDGDGRELCLVSMVKGFDANGLSESDSGELLRDFVLPDGTPCGVREEK